MIRAIFFDIDGTLLSFETHRVPQSTQHALFRLREQGVKLFVATGRPPKTAAYLREVFNFPFDGYVTMNGQYCLVNGQVIYDNCIPTESIASLLPYLEKQKIACNFVEEDFIYTNFHNDLTRELSRKLGGEDIFGPTVDVRRALAHKVYQLSAFITEPEEPAFLRHIPGCKAARWMPLFTDIMPVNGGKPVGMDQIIGHFGIAPDEVMAFGDGGNDLDMLVHAQIGVAMGNAVDAVKAAADYITDDVDHDGVWNALINLGILQGCVSGDK